MTLESLANIRASIGFLGCSGVRPDTTVLDTTGIEVPVKHALLAASSNIVLLADETKFPGWASARSAPPRALARW